MIHWSFLSSEVLFYKLCWENWIITCRKLKLGGFSNPVKKFKDHKVRFETLKLLEENITETL
jgi:hypothetical protein